MGKQLSKAFKSQTSIFSIVPLRSATNENEPARNGADLVNRNVRCFWFFLPLPQTIGLPDAWSIETELFFIGRLAGNVNDSPQWRGSTESDSMLDIARYELAAVKHEGRIRHAEVSGNGQINAARFKLTNPMHCQSRLVRHNRIPARPQRPHRELIVNTRHPNPQA